MSQRYLATGLAVLIDALVLAILTAVLAMLYWLVTGASGEYLAIVSNILFIEGGAILTFGALIAFFRMGGTQEIRRMMTSSVLLFGWRKSLQAASEDKKYDEESAGLLLVFLGALLIVFSFLTSINYII
jgi:hypothetical protein